MNWAYVLYISMVTGVAGWLLAGQFGQDKRLSLLHERLELVEERLRLYKFRLEILGERIGGIEIRYNVNRAFDTAERIAREGRKS